MNGSGMHGWLLAAAPAGASTGMSGWMMLATLFVVFVLPFAGGAFVARRLKVADMSNRISIIFFVGMLGLTPFVWQYIQGSREQADYAKAMTAWEAEGKEKGEKAPKKPEPRTWRSAIRLGIDLEGGTNLVFQVDPNSGKEITTEVMNQMVAAVSRRINPTGTEDVVVRAVGKDRIEVIVPGADPDAVARIKALITRLGSLEFAILADERTTAHQKAIEAAQTAKTDVRDANGRVTASWREVATDNDGKPKVPGHSERTTRTVKKDGKDVTEILVYLEPEDRRVTGKYLTRAFPTSDDNGAPAVGFNFNTRGGYLFQNLTSTYRPRQNDDPYFLAILLDGKIHSAPRINQTISNTGIITGRFTRAEVDDLISVLNAGALEVPIEPDPISEFSVGPLLAHDVQEKGMMAVYVSFALVFVLMLAYYRFAGIVANLCLLMNLVLIMASMAYIDATFTLPGIAGIVLTVGMAVDSNVLIFERMREERAKGASIRMTVQNGFDRALSAIVDGNVSSLITAVILYMIGTDQIRGFAVTLFIGLSVSMFTAVFMGRVIFALAERKRWLTELNMMSLFKVPHIDWIGWCKPAVALSAAFIVAGMAALFTRGIDNLDIDFTGGTMVTLEFEKPQELQSVKKVLQESELGSATSVERLALLTDAASEQSDSGTRYRIRSKEQDIDKVGKIINDSLTKAGYDLRHVTVDYGEVVDLTVPDTKPMGLTEFPQGREVVLTFSGAVKPTTGSEYFLHALNQLKNADGASKYEQPGTLYAIEGVGEPKDGTEGYERLRLMLSPDLAGGDVEASLLSMKQRLATEPVFDEVNTFDSSVATEMQEAALVAIFFSLLAIIAYIWFRFERVTWGFAAVAALAHDVLVVVGSIPLAAYLSHTPIGPLLGLEDFKINLGVVASVLTIIGYSLNDTIVIFDRIREIRGKNPALTADMLNLSVNQTLSRTILTAASTFVVVIIMYALGGEGLHGFAFTMIVGVVSGTWSTIFMSNPALLWLMNRSGAEPVRAAPLGSPKAAAG